MGQLVMRRSVTNGLDLFQYTCSMMAYGAEKMRSVLDEKWVYTSVGAVRPGTYATGQKYILGGQSLARQVLLCQILCTSPRLFRTKILLSTTSSKGAPLPVRAVYRLWPPVNDLHSGKGWISQG